MQKIKVKNFFYKIQWHILRKIYWTKRKYKNLLKYLSAFGYRLYFCLLFCWHNIFVTLRWNIKEKNPSITCLLFWHKRHTIAETNYKQGGKDANVNIQTDNKKTSKLLHRWFTWQKVTEWEQIRFNFQSKVIKYNNVDIFYIKQKENHFQ